MYFEKAEICDIRKKYKNTKLQKLLTEFVDAGIPVARVLADGYANKESLRNSLRAATLRHHFDHVIVMLRADGVYLANTILAEEVKK